MENTTRISAVMAFISVIQYISSGCEIESLGSPNFIYVLVTFSYFTNSMLSPSSGDDKIHKLHELHESAIKEMKDAHEKRENTLKKELALLLSNHNGFIKRNAAEKQRLEASRRSALLVNNHLQGELESAKAAVYDSTILISVRCMQHTYDNTRAVLAEAGIEVSNLEDWTRAIENICQRQPRDLAAMKRERGVLLADLDSTKAELATEKTAKEAGIKKAAFLEEQLAQASRRAELLRDEIDKLSAGNEESMLRKQVAAGQAERLAAEEKLKQAEAQHKLSMEAKEKECQRHQAAAESGSGANEQLKQAEAKYKLSMADKEEQCQKHQTEAETERAAKKHAEETVTSMKAQFQEKLRQKVAAGVAAGIQLSEDETEKYVNSVESKFQQELQAQVAAEVQSKTKHQSEMIQKLSNQHKHEMEQLSKNFKNEYSGMEEKLAREHQQVTAQMSADFEKKYGELGERLSNDHRQAIKQMTDDFEGVHRDLAAKLSEGHQQEMKQVSDDFNNQYRTLEQKLSEMEQKSHDSQQKNNSQEQTSAEEFERKIEQMREVSKIKYDKLQHKFVAAELAKIGAEQEVATHRDFADGYLETITELQTKIEKQAQQIVELKNKKRRFDGEHEDDMDIGSPKDEYGQAGNNASLAFGNNDDIAAGNGLTDHGLGGLNGDNFKSKFVNNNTFAATSTGYTFDKVTPKANYGFNPGNATSTGYTFDKVTPKANYGFNPGNPTTESLRPDSWKPNTNFGPKASDTDKSTLGAPNASTDQPDGKASSTSGCWPSTATGSAANKTNTNSELASGAPNTSTGLFNGNKTSSTSGFRPITTIGPTTDETKVNADFKFGAQNASTNLFNVTNAKSALNKAGNTITGSLFEKPKNNEFALSSGDTNTNVQFGAQNANTGHLNGENVFSVAAKTAAAPTFDQSKTDTNFSFNNGSTGFNFNAEDTKLGNPIGGNAKPAFSTQGKATTGSLLKENKNKANTSANTNFSFSFNTNLTFGAQNTNTDPAIGGGKAADKPS